MPIKIGVREFAPRPFTTLLTLALLAMLISLGRWQLRRAAEKQRLYDEFSSGVRATLHIDAATPPLTRYQHIETAGRYDSSRQILIDNMASPDGRAGYFVVTPFAMQGGGWILVNRGWIPFGASRRDKPDVAVATDERTIRGRADNLPAPGIRLGAAAALAPPFPVIATYPRFADLQRLLRDTSWAKAAPLVLLDRDQADGYMRGWSPPGFPPIRYIGYAVQWFGLALTLLVIYVVTNVRRCGDVRKPSDAGN